MELSFHHTLCFNLNHFKATEIQFPSSNAFCLLFKQNNKTFFEMEINKYSVRSPILNLKNQSYAFEDNIFLFWKENTLLISQQVKLYFWEFFDQFSNS